MPAFADVFGFPPEATASAPGRVNLLGEHTDYNDGYVLPTVIPQTTTVKVARSRDGFNRFHSEQLDATVNYRAGESPADGFALYIHGCIELLRERGHAIDALTLHVDSQVPIGSGLSSSAALEVATLRALRMLYQLQLDDVTLASMAQQAEIRFARVRCGIMDQMASSLGAPGQMLFLDTRTLESRLLPLPPNAAFMVLDSGVPRSLAASAYNQRRSECEQAAQLLGVRALRDIEKLDRLARLPAPLDRRARHVVTENRRVLEAAGAVDAGRFGELMNASHASLRDDFEVSVPALDSLVEILQRHPQVYGARLTGAGFGGASVALIEPGAQAAIQAKVLKEYEREGYRGSVLV